MSKENPMNDDGNVRRTRKGTLYMIDDPSTDITDEQRADIKRWFTEDLHGSNIVWTGPDTYDIRDANGVKVGGGFRVRVPAEKP